MSCWSISTKRPKSGQKLRNFENLTVHKNKTVNFSKIIFKFRDFLRKNFRIKLS